MSDNGLLNNSAVCFILDWLTKEAGMKIAIPSKTTEGLFAEVEEHFGRARIYTFIEIDEEGDPVAIEVEEVNFEGHGPGEIPSWVKSHGADVVLTGGMGQRAIEFFRDMGIEVVTGVSGTIKDVIKEFLGGKLQGKAEPCHESQEHAH